MAQEQNPFYVKPVDITPGVGMLAGAIRSRGEFEREKAKKEGLRQKLMEGFSLSETGSPDEVAEFMAANPEVSQQLKETIGFKNEETERRLLEAAKKAYTGEIDPLEAAVSHGESLIQEGADPSNTIEWAKEAAKSPEMGREEAGRIWASIDSSGFTAFKKATTAPEVKDTRTKEMKNYDFAKEQGYEGSFADYTKGKPVGKWQPWGYGQMRNTETGELKDVQTPPRRGETIRSLPGGGFEIIRGDGKGKTQKFTEVQAKTGGFANRVEASNKIAGDLEDTLGFDATSISEAIKGAVPGFGNILSSEDRQVYNQAKLDFITAVLRLESGAAIAPKEFEKEDKKYFPQPGDKPKVIANKRKARERQFRILKGGSGGAYEAMRSQIDEPADTATGEMTQEQYSKLPSGATYTYGGKTYRKK